MSTPHQPSEREYVLGTGEAEVRRLFDQHIAWRPFVFDAWRRAGFRPGQILLDVGCGPGAATLDLAELAGPSGRTLGVDQSTAFLGVLRERAGRRYLQNIATHSADLESWQPSEQVDGAWCRWVFSFLREPGRLTAVLHGCLVPGACVVVHEYYDYGAWTLHPAVPELDEFVSVVMRSWRDAGGEPNVGVRLPTLLIDSGFEIIEQRPIAQVVTARDHGWRWLAGYVASGTDRLCRLGYLTAMRAAEITRAFASAEARPGSLMVAPAVLEIVARNRKDGVSVDEGT